MASDPNETSTISFFRWLQLLLQPGIGIKRWLLLGGIGLLVLAAALAASLASLLEVSEVNLAKRLTLSGSFSDALRGMVLAASGATLAGLASFMLYRRLAWGARLAQGSRGIIEGLSGYHYRSGGPKIVAIGGGTGLSSLLRGLKEHSHSITAIVTVADNGGSSGRLRDEMGMPPPGDARQCLIALSDSEPLMEQVFSHRFQSGEGLEGHSVGNLLLAALMETEGDFGHALQAAGKLLAVRGQVVPSSLNSEIRLMARLESGWHATGESEVGRAGERLESLWLEPQDSEANPAAIEAIEEADIIVIGPGSLYTSILPNFLLSGIRDAVDGSDAPKIFVCNIATEHGETDGLGTVDHLREFEHYAEIHITHFLVNSYIRPIDPEFHQQPLEPVSHVTGDSIQVLQRNLIDSSKISHHDPAHLATAVLEAARSR
jgi:uncharacterized cofD-like protein